MFGWFSTFGVWALGVLGALSLAVLGAASVYLLESLRRRRRYFALMLTLSLLSCALLPTGVVILTLASSAVVLVQASFYFYFGVRTLLKKRATSRPSLAELPHVTIVVPAKNEARIIEGTLRSLDELDYPRERLEIVLVDDGSSDPMPSIARTLGREMQKRLVLVRHDDSAGKALRLNQELARSSADFVVVLDADHWVDPRLIRRMLEGFAQGPNVACVQVASAVRNANTNLLTKLVELEYLFRCRGVYPGKRMGMFYGSGAMFRREALLAVGGFDTSMLTEDIEVTYRLYKSGQRIVYDDSVSSYDLAPSDFKNFFTQRHRWMRGLWQAMLLHLKASSSLDFSARVRAYFVQFTLDGFGALCLCVLEAYAFLRELGVVAFAPISPIVFMLASCAFAFSVGCARGRRPQNLLFLPLVPVYIVLHTIPMAWALIDSYALGKPFVWVKTERGASERPAVSLSGGEA